VLQPLGAGQVNAAVSLKINWNTFVPIALIGGVFALITMMVPYGLGPLGALLIALATGYTGWQLSSQVPEAFIGQILAALGGTPVAAPPPPVPQPPPPIAQPAPPPPPAAPPAPIAPPVAAAPAPIAPPPDAAPEADDADEIMDQIKRLAELRDAGALTPAEFDAKKTELLARL
jgi:hypothetical protein